MTKIKEKPLNFLRGFLRFLKKIGAITLSDREIDKYIHKKRLGMK